MRGVSDIEPWMCQLLDDLMHGRPPANRLPVVIAVRVARDSPHGGPPWVRRLASAPTATDRACAAACHLLATEGEEPPVDVAKRLLVSQDCWARFHAALALRGPWAAQAIDALE